MAQGFDRFDLEALAPYWTRAQGWWNERTLREQVLLGCLAAAGILALLLLVLMPLRDARAEARADIRSAALLEARLRSGSDLTRLGTVRTGTASAIVTDSAAAAQLPLLRTVPVGSNIQVSLQDAPFDTVMTWIADVEATSNLRLKSLQLSGQGAPGLVTAELVLGE